MDDAEQLKRKYEEEGYLVFPEVLDPETVRLASEHVEWLRAKHPELRPEQLHHRLMWEDPFWVRLVSDARLLDRVQAVLGPNLALFASHYICKPGGDGLPVLWHQDGSYWPLEPMVVVSGWLAVDDSTVENGCMRVIPGSHRGPMLAHHTHDKSAVLHTEIHPDDIDTAQAVDVEIPAGGVSLHHPLLIHGSNPNHSPRRRCGLTIRYIPPPPGSRSPTGPPSCCAGSRCPASTSMRTAPPTGTASTFPATGGYRRANPRAE